MTAEGPLRPFRFGYIAAQARTGAAWKDTAKRAEALGFSSLLLPDTTGPILAPFSALATAAAVTSTLHVGNWVLANDFRHPVIVAREAATLDLMSDGRFELGLGAGRGDNDYASLGLEPGSGGQRLRRLAESTQIIRALFSGKPVTFNGEHYTIHDAKLYPEPQRQVPILVAASGPKAVDMAGRYADIVALGCHSRELWNQQRGWLQAAAGERFGQIELASVVFVVSDADERSAQGGRAFVRQLGMDLDTMIANDAPNVVIGSPDAMIEQLQERRASLGLSYIVVGGPDPDLFEPIVKRLAGT